MTEKFLRILAVLGICVTFGIVGRCDYEEARRQECHQMNMRYDQAKDRCRPLRAPELRIDPQTGRMIESLGQVNPRAWK